MAIVNTPLFFQRTVSGPLDYDLVFSSTTTRTSFLTSGHGSSTKYAGMIVADTQDGNVYVLDPTATTWIPININYNNFYSVFISQSANNLSVYTQVNSLSSGWGNGGSSISASVSGNWQSTYVTVSSLSSTWNSISFLQALSANDQSVYSSFNAQSANNASVYTQVNTLSSGWGGSSISASVSGNWQSTYATVSSLSANWNTAYQAVSSIPYILNQTLSSTNTIIGLNVSNAKFSEVLGGSCNAASGCYSTVVNGFSSCATGYGTFVGGGSAICATGCYSVAVGGRLNTASGCYSFIGSGFCNSTSTGTSNVIIGGSNNNILGTGNANFIGGGNFNCTNVSGGVITGGCCNIICGGGNNFTTIAGGTNNCIYNGQYSNIGGGNCNLINTGSFLSPNATIAGGSGNIVCSPASSILGGYSNTIYTNSGCSAILGGCKNNLNGIATTIVGGFKNTTSSAYSFIAGGSANDTKGFTNTFILGTLLSANQANFTYVNNISSQGFIYDSIGNSSQWNSSYTSFNAQSANNASVYTSVNSNSASWNPVGVYLPLSGGQLTGALTTTSTISAQGNITGNSVAINTQIQFLTGNNFVKVYQFYNSVTNSIDTIFN